MYNIRPKPKVITKFIRLKEKGEKSLYCTAYIYDKGNYVLAILPLYSIKLTTLLQ